MYLYRNKKLQWQTVESTVEYRLVGTRCWGREVASKLKGCTRARRRSGRGKETRITRESLEILSPTRLIMNAAQLVMNGQACSRPFLLRGSFALVTHSALWLLEGVATCHSRRNPRMANATARGNSFSLDNAISAPWKNHCWSETRVSQESEVL